MRPRLDSRSLALFVAVAESLSFRRAAEAVPMAQPPLSRAIRTLEERLGTRLFERDTQAVSLTAAGRRLLPRARRILQLLVEAEQAVRARDAPTVLRLGLTTAVEPEHLLRFVQRVRARHPELVVTTVSDTSPRLVRLLRSRRLDAALIALPTESVGLDVTPVTRQPMIVALRSTHRLARRRRLALRDLAGEPMFWFERSRQSAFFDHCQSVFQRHGFAPDAVREPSDHHVLLGQVADGTALALLPRSFMSLRRAGVSYRPLLEGEELAVGIGLAVPSDAPALRDSLMKQTAHLRA